MYVFEPININSHRTYPFSDGRRGKNLRHRKYLLGNEIERKTAPKGKVRGVGPKGASGGAASRLSVRICSAALRTLRTFTFITRLI